MDTEFQISKPPRVPVQNIYHLLTYAWDERLNQQEHQKVDAAACPDLTTLFARVLTHGVARLRRRGLDRDYVEFRELTARVRGKIDFRESAKRRTWTEGRLHCVADELSHDVPHNRILKAALSVLHRDPALAKKDRLALGHALEAFGQVTAVPLHAALFRRVRLHRNNRCYRFLLQLCELIHRSYLPDPAEAGKLRFQDILADEKTMSAIFEKFVLHFARRHIPDATASAMWIQWNTGGPVELLPGMHTDVTLEWSERKLILDCKYYKDALSGQFDKKRFISSNLYQLNAYLTNKSAEAGWENVEGALL